MPPILGPPLVDTFGRRHSNLRISVTDRCNLRCVYCMPESAEFLPRAEVLSFEEIERVARVAAGSGVDKVRLTGGEPLVRRGLPELVRRLAAIDGIADLGLTTNGLLLAPAARDLFAAGLRRLNVSLDTLDPATFARLARRPGLDAVLDGLEAARAAGFRPIKVNAVVLRGVNDGEVAALARFARDRGFEMRFIESMPLGAAGSWDRAGVVAADEILATLSDAFGPLDRDPDADPRAPAADYLYGDGGGRVGIIASITRPFCGACNRLRLTADGKLRNCLFAVDETDLRGLLRSGADDEAIRGAFLRSVRGKWAGHDALSPTFEKPGRLMHAIGG